MSIRYYSSLLHQSGWRITPLLLGALLFSAHSRADWVNNRLSGMPSDAIVGGQTVSGVTSYLCRAYHGYDIQPGWTVKGDSTCHFSYGGREMTATDFDWWVPSWAPVIGGSYPMPTNLIPFRGENNAFRYPCRVGGTLGKFGFDLGGCLYPYGGAELHQSGNGYQVLVDPDGGNVDFGADMTPTTAMVPSQYVGPFVVAIAGLYEGQVVPLPADAIVGGSDGDGQPLYLCSADVTVPFNPEQIDQPPPTNQGRLAQTGTPATCRTEGMKTSYQRITSWSPTGFIWTTKKEPA